MLILALTLFPISIFIHEMLHTLTSIILGYTARLSFEKLGFSVRIPSFEGYKNLFELKGKSRKDYIIIAVAPYLMLPLYFYLYFNQSFSIVTRISAWIIIIYHLASLPLEFFQERHMIALFSLIPPLATLLLFF